MSLDEVMVSRLPQVSLAQCRRLMSRLQYLDAVRHWPSLVRHPGHVFSEQTRLT